MTQAITVKASKKLASEVRKDLLEIEASVGSLMNKPVEALAVSTKRLVSCDTTHAFGKAALDAFYEHHPLRIRPDDIWFCITQGFATHVNQNAETLRKRFVNHEGKIKLVVERTDFQLGQLNPWPEAFAAFSAQVGQHVGKLQDLVAARFSTTTPFESAAFDVAVMDTFQGYFEYAMMGGCGIPEIHLEGTEEDWRSIITRTRHLSEYGLEFWTDALLPVLEKIALTAGGQVEPEFWESFFRYKSGSGPAEMTGWILTLFPYLETFQAGPVVNPWLANWRPGLLASLKAAVSGPSGSNPNGPGIGALPSSLVSAPVQFIDMPTGEEHNLRFVAGMFGVQQEESKGTLAPAFGWAILHEDGEPDV